VNPALAAALIARRAPSVDNVHGGKAPPPSPAVPIVDNIHDRVAEQAAEARNTIIVDNIHNDPPPSRARSKEHNVSLALPEPPPALPGAPSEPALQVEPLAAPATPEAPPKLEETTGDVVTLDSDEPLLTPLERARQLMELARERARQPRQPPPLKPKPEPGPVSLDQVREGCEAALEALEPLRIETPAKHGERALYRSMHHALAAARRELERVLATATRVQ
jgi:hypothetical protein